MSLSTLFLSINFISFIYASYQECGSYFPNDGVTFDLSPLTLTDQTNLSYYLVRHATENYEFIFNFCADLVTMPFPGACNWEDRKVSSLGNEIFRPKNTTSMAWQAEEDGNGFCFRISGPETSEDNKYNTSDLITYELIDSYDPSYGVMMHYNYGDYDSGCGWHKNRQFDIAIVCDPAINNIPDEGEIITEPNKCEYYMEIKSIYGCPLECGRDQNNILCSGNGLCGYDHSENIAKCNCYAGFGGSICNETVVFEGDITWYDAIGCESNSTYSFEFDTIYGYPVHYDLQWFIDGYLNGSNGNKHYKLNGPSLDTNYYLNIFESQPVDVSICSNNPPTYEYGLLYQASKTDSNAPCYSLGRTLGNVSLFEPTLPERGIHISLEEGDALHCPGVGNSRRTDIYLICPSSSNKVELYESNTGLNNIYSDYYFSEPTTCRYEIEIYTTAACPCQCISYDDYKDSISTCNQNGICGYDQTLDLVRCFCNDNMKINDPQDVHCKIPNATYAPTTSEPTNAPTLSPITRIECGDYYIGHTRYEDDTDNFTFSVNSPIGSKAIFNSCGSSFDTILHFDYNGNRIDTNDDGSHAECGDRSSLLAVDAIPNRNYTLIIEAWGTSYGQYHINVTCTDLTALPTTNPTLSPTPRPTEGYSLYGEWTHYDYHTDEIYQAKISVDEMCQFVKFEFITSAGCIDSWFGFGIGGNYYFEHDKAGNNMNGYALISFMGGVPDGYNQIYETILKPGDIPEPQTNQHLRNCSSEIRDCMQYTVCYRNVITSDNDNDFFRFKEGANHVIWAYGNTANATFMPLKHLKGNARENVIFLEGESVCDPTTTATTETTEATVQITITSDIDEESKESISQPAETTDAWKIVAIIFIILFVLTLIFVTFKIYKTRNKEAKSTQGYVHTHGRVNSSEIIV
eukprot:83109_1